MSHSALEKKKRKIIVLGAGISGLAAARRLLALGADVSLWESSSRVGGVIDTVQRGGLQFEQSTDNFITTVPTVIELCRELGLEDDLVQTNNRDRRTYVVRKGRLHPLPDGFMMLAPTKLWPMVVTPLLSPFGKLRAGLELLIPRKKDSADETIGRFARRRLGREATERIVEPLLSGIYAGDAEKISLEATLPRFRELERKYRSLIVAMTLGQRAARRAKRQEESGARYSLFMTLRSGLAELPKAIARRFPEGTLRLNRRAVSVRRQGADRWLVSDDAGQSETCDGVICALPSYVAGELFTESVPEAARFYNTMEQTGCAVCSMAFKTEQIRAKFAGMGFVVPTIEGGILVAGSFSSHKYPHRAPEGITLLRLFVGGARAPEVVEMEPEALMKRVLDEIRPMLRIEGEPFDTELARWPRGMPQYYLGHLDRLAELDKALERYPGLALCGNSFRGVGIPACVESGYRAAEGLCGQVKES
ncbi:MAG: protoporphyrinogen oxidase [Thermoguttaceae bacterium]|nr:protoporphyrinogen oxidase [Thermoguttaceae bacterium]